MEPTPHQEYVTLRDYFQGQLNTLIKEIDGTKLEVKEKFVEVNFIRKQITDERGLYYTKDAMDARIGPIEIRMRVLENAKSNLDGKHVVIIALVTAAINLAFWFFRR